MDESEVQFRKVAIEPWQCLKSAKAMVTDEYWMFVGICAVGVLLAGLAPMGLLMGPMYCGIYLCYIHHRRGEEISFNLLFTGFDYFLESLIASLVMMAAIGAAVMVVLLPTYAIFIGMSIGFGAAGGHGQPGPEMGLIMFGLMAFVWLVVMVFMVVAGALLAFVFPLMVDRNMKAIPAIKTSVKAGWTNFGGMIGLMLLIGLLTTLASMCCYVPYFLVLPIAIGGVYAAYLKVFPDEPVEVDASGA